LWRWHLSRGIRAFIDAVGDAIPAGRRAQFRTRILAEIAALDPDDAHQRRRRLASNPTSRRVMGQPASDLVDGGMCGRGFRSSSWLLKSDRSHEGRPERI
jgi:hypothetical protein